jgi:hypothetical protein
MKKRKVLILLLALGFGLTAGVAKAAKPAISVEETEWILSGKIGVNVAKVGKVKVEGDVQLLIGPNETEELAENEFKFTDGNGFSFTGSVALNNKTYILTPDSDELEAYLESLLLVLAASEEIQATINNIDVRVVKISVKPNATPTGISAMWTVNIKASFDGTIDGDPIETNVSLVMKHRGEIEIPIPGSSWMIDITMQAAVKSMAKQKDDGTLTLLLGPNEDEELGEGEYKGEGDEGELFTGTFAVGDKGKVDFQLNEEQVEAFLATMFMAQIDPQFGITNVTADIISDKTKISAKVSPGVSINFSLKLSFDLVFTTAFGDLPSSGTLSIKGTGVPQ